MLATGLQVKWEDTQLLPPSKERFPSLLINFSIFEQQATRNILSTKHGTPSLIQAIHTDCVGISSI